MMAVLRTPTDLERESLAHLYDPLQAHEYYLRTRKLHPRQKGAQPEGFAKANAKRHDSAKTKQKAELAARITSLSKKLSELEDLIRTKEAALKRGEAKTKAKKERAAKAKDKPKTAADKAKAARENKKYRQKHHQQLKTKAKQASKSGGGSSSSKKPREMPIADLKALATKVRGQIAVAKQKLAAL